MEAAANLWLTAETVTRGEVQPSTRDNCYTNPLGVDRTMRLSAGDRLGQYEILSPLGAGGMGEVYRARDIELEREVALKVLPDRLARDSDAGSRFRREAKALASLSHPNILTLFTFGSEGSVAYAVSELLEGETLGERITRRGAVAWREVLDIGLSVADGLAAAHAKGITHRDIKPANLFLIPDGVVQILDFGLARSMPLGPVTAEDETMALPEGATATGVILGTVGYMSPEQAKGEPAGPASDVFSLGCVLYEMLTGLSPFARSSQAETLVAILRETPAPLVTADGVPRELRRIVLQALEKEPSSRYPSAANLRDELAALRDSLEAKEAGSLWAVMRRPRVAVPLLFLGVLLSFFGVRSFQRGAERQWARQEALPEVMRLIAAEEYPAAFDLAREVERIVPDDPMLVGLWDEMSNTVSVETDPPGAVVFYRQNAATEAEWLMLGLSPIIDRRLPLGGFRLRVEKEGFEPHEILSALSYPQSDGTFAPLPRFSTPDERNRFSLLLDPTGSVPAGMVAVDGGVYEAALRGVSLEPVTLAPFFIDRTEVSNARFKEFVDAGGYQRPEYWQHEFRRDGRSLTWEEAMAELIDTTGRPGPATWELGDYPEGEGDYPVGGVSWYEAAAYADFRGNRLPTAYHWIRAALPGSEHVLPLAPDIITLSNFGGEGLAPVGSSPGIGVSGASDLAGNVREWCWNTSGEHRLILGGAWSEPTYRFTWAVAADPFDRSAINGFRSMQERAGDTPEELDAPVELNSIDFTAVEPLSDDAFAVYERQFAYTKAPLNPVLEATEDSASDWRRESVSIDAAYGGERFTVHLDLPKQGSPPYQAVVYFPGDNAFEQPTFEAAYWERFEYIPKSGRVLVRPILSGMYERIDRTRSFSEYLPRMIKDLARTLDYLESRDDIDADKIAFMGLSGGAWIAPITLSAEDRFKVAVLISGGLYGTLTTSFAPRVTTPVLMLGGRYDYENPVETHQQGMMDLFSTPEEHKRLVIYDAGHLPLPRGEMIREILEWLDRYLGASAPPARAAGPG